MGAWSREEDAQEESRTPLLACLRGGTAGATEGDAVVVDDDTWRPSPAMGDRLRRCGTGGMSEDGKDGGEEEVKDDDEEDTAMDARRPFSFSLPAPARCVILGVLLLLNRSPANDSGRVGRRMGERLSKACCSAAWTRGELPSLTPASVARK